jgi:hypothetical protein
VIQILRSEVVAAHEIYERITVQYDRGKFMNGYKGSEEGRQVY